MQLHKHPASSDGVSRTQYFNPGIPRTNLFKANLNMENFYFDVTDSKMKVSKRKESVLFLSTVTCV